MDDIEFMISLNPGQPVKPLAGVAKRREGAVARRHAGHRKTVMAKRDDMAIETLIFYGGST
ncbi:MAG: hypothetical protein ACLTT1_12570 [[Clostridium] scindens]